MRGFFFFITAGLVILACAGVKAVGQTPAPVGSQRVLILYSDERMIPASIIVDQGIHEVFTGENSKHIELYSEFLDVARFPGEEQRERQRIFFREKYLSRPHDLVIAVAEHGRSGNHHGHRVSTSGHHSVHPGAAVVIGPILICFPYAVSRALTTRLARRLGGIDKG